MDTPPISLALTELGIPHQVFQHKNPVTSFEQAARERGQRETQIVRSILFRISEDEYVLALVAGPGQISWKALRKYLGRSRITMATEDEVLAVTGYKIGTVGPFALRSPVRVLIEAGVIREEEISIGSGMRDRAIILKSIDLQRALKGADVVSLIGEETIRNGL
jgi:Cys-tRNA(Pro) deacylase